MSIISQSYFACHILFYFFFLIYKQRAVCKLKLSKMAEFVVLDPNELENILQRPEFEVIPNLGEPLQPASSNRKRFADLNQDDLFVCVEVIRPSQSNGVMSSAVSLPNHTFTGQA